MRFSKYNNPNKKRRKKVISRTDADIIASKMMFDDTRRGIELPLSYYDRKSDELCGKKSRNIYEV